MVDLGEGREELRQGRGIYPEESISFPSGVPNWWDPKLLSQKLDRVP